MMLECLWLNHACQPAGPCSNFSFWSPSDSLYHPKQLHCWCTAPNEVYRLRLKVDVWNCSHLKPTSHRNLIWREFKQAGHSISSKPFHLNCRMCGQRLPCRLWERDNSPECHLQITHTRLSYPWCPGRVSGSRKWPPHQFASWQETECPSNAHMHGNSTRRRRCLCLERSWGKSSCSLTRTIDRTLRLRCTGWRSVCTCFQIGAHSRTG